MVVVVNELCPIILRLLRPIAKERTKERCDQVKVVQTIALWMVGLPLLD